MAYNLPPPWDPGFALPQNVRDEGLQRRAFVTKQQPRGSYDNPSVGYGGYAVPQYIKDEGYGQGTFTTKWMPSGTYVGPKVPHWLNQRPKVVRQQRMPGGGMVSTVQALGDAPMAAPLEAYGQKAADILITRVSALPTSQRTKTLRAMMDALDTSLWPRTQTILKRYLAQGMTTVQAFPLALARALSAGMAAEIVMTGLRRTAPQANSLLGLGCYGCASAVLGALGAIALPTVGTWVGGGGTTTRPPSPTTTPPPPAPCAPDPNRPGICAGTIGSGPAPGNVLTVAGLQFVADRLVRAWAPNTPPSATIANRAAPPDVQIDDPANLPPDTVAFIRSLILATPSTPKADVGGYMGTGYGHYPEWDATPWFAALGIDNQTPLVLPTMANSLRLPTNPVAQIQRPVTGEKLVLHIQLGAKDPSKASDPTTNPLVFKAWLSRMVDPTFWASVTNSLISVPVGISQIVLGPVMPVAVAVGTGIVDVGGKVAGAIGTGLKDLGDLACHLLQTPGVGVAAGAAAGAPAAGAAGQAIAKGACGTPPPAAPPPIAQTNILPLALLAGGAVLAVALLTRGSNGKKTPP